MGIRFSCPNGHRLNVKAHLAGKRGVCPQCGAKVIVPAVEDATGTSTGRSPERSPPSGDQNTLPQMSADILTDSASPSVIIQVAEGSEPPEPARELSPPSDKAAERLQLGSAPPIIAATPVAVIPEKIVPPAPETRYLIQRERRRRNQLKLAIGLLVAVIVLAVLLIIVLQRGAGQPAATVGENVIADKVSGISS
jgi:hypothetical protein